MTQKIRKAEWWEVGSATPIREAEWWEIGRAVPVREAEWWELGWARPVREAEWWERWRAVPVRKAHWWEFGRGGSDAAAVALGVLLTVGLLVLLALAVGALLALVFQILAALFNGWRNLVRQHPRFMLVVHLLLGMVAVGGGLRLAGFDSSIQLAGVALVPALWGWLWLTRRLPLVFMPINALLVGGGLWLVAHLTRPAWLFTWSRLTTGLPLVENLPLALAALPMILWLWGLGARRWPQVFHLLNLLALGAVSCFVLMRVWTDWQPLWASWFEPVPLLPQAAGWLIFLLPLGLWLWGRGQARWPVLFTIFNLLLFGGLLGLTAHHTQPAWLATWRHWAAGLPFAAAPVLTISLSPLALWSWSQASRRWTKVLLIPNLLLTGGIMWLVLDRTRPLWGDLWRAAWGNVPLGLDPAVLMLILPLAVWAWGQGSRHWPRYWGAARAALCSGVLWWIAERTRGEWHAAWVSFAGAGAPDLALLAALVPPLLWGRLQLYRRWPRAVQAVTAAGVTLLLGWATGRLLPESQVTFRVAVALLPLVVWGWLWLLRHHPRIGWPLALLPLVGMGLFAWLLPDSFRILSSTFMAWLAAQGGF